MRDPVKLVTGVRGARGLFMFARILDEGTRRGYEMKNRIFSISAIVLAVAVVFIWSRTEHVPLQASAASSINFGPRAAVSSEATQLISPTELMMNYKGPLPTEQWDPI